ncbi:MAG: DUF4112 domain-containing protein [Cellvibrionaceae bacterium]
MTTRQPCGESKAIDTDTEFRQRHLLGWLLDSSIPLPGGYRIGLDGIIGLIPGVGDAIGGGLSTWIVYQAYQQNLPKMVLARMIINILIDAGLGAVPIIGDVFDFFWKANLRNARLLERYQHSPRETYQRSAVTTIGFVLGLFAVVLLLIVAVVSLVGLVWNAVVQ